MRFLKIVEQRIKQRLIGAVVLVALMVIILPLVFDGQGVQRLPDALFDMPDSQLGKVSPPDKPFFHDELGDASEIRARKIDDAIRQATVRSLIPDAPAGSGEPGEGLDEKTMMTPGRSGKTPDGAPLERSDGKAAPVKAPPPAARVPDPHPWRVQLASFRNEATAYRLASRLKDQGHRAVVQPEHNAGRGAWFVVVLVTHGTYAEVQQLTKHLSERYRDVGKPIIRRGGP